MSGDMGAVTPGGDERDRRLVEAGLLLAEEPTLWRVVECVTGLAIELTGAASATFDAPQALATGAEPSVPLRVGGRELGRLRVSEKVDGGGFTDEDVETLHALAAVASPAIAGLQPRDQLLRQVRWLEAAAELSREALAGAEPEAVLRVAVRRARELLGADLAIALLLDGDGWSRVAAADGAPGPTAGTGTVALAPLAGRSGPLGSLVVAGTAPPRRFDEGDRDLLHRLAEHTSAVLEHVRSRHRLERLLPLDDLEHLTTDLHDAVVQALYAVGLGLEGTMAAADDPWLAERIEGALTDIDAVIREVRTLIVGLHPALAADAAM